MKHVYFLVLLSFLYSSSFGLNITIVESQSIHSGQDMDIEWSNVASAMGHTPNIVPQSTLDNNSFFLSTDVLIISSGRIFLPPNRVNTILQFIQTGKPVYLQCEYLDSLSTNRAFQSIVTSLGGSFSWNNSFTGDLNPVNVMGSFSDIINNVTSLSYYWYSVSGIGDCNTINYLEKGGEYHGFQYIPTNPSWGSIITNTDQDWINRSINTSLLENILANLISPPSIPKADLGNDTTICQNETLVLNSTINMGTYLWNDSSSNSTLNVTELGTYWVDVTVNGCSYSDTIQVSLNPLPTINIGNDTTICEGETISLDANTTNATYIWNDNSTNPTLKINQQGTYWVDVMVNNCRSSDTIQINLNPLPTVNIGNDTTICEGETISLDANTTNATYLWNDNSTNPTLTIDQQGIYWVNVMVNNCRSSDTIQINLNPLPIVNIGNDTTICEGETVSLDANTTNATYLWNDNSTNPTLEIDQQGSYWVDVTVDNCRSSDTIQINLNPLPTVNIGNDTTICEGEILTLNTNITNATYLWNDNSTNPTLTVDQQGTYWVDVMVNNCHSSDTIQINLNPLPTVSIGNDTTICEGETISLDANTTSATYLWNDNSTNSTLIVDKQGTYWVDVTVNNCSSTNTILVNEGDCEIAIEIPNIFTPNNDGINDLFTPSDSKGIFSMNTIIYNRSGKKIFETNNPLIEWDGQNVSDGTYFWIIHYVDSMKNESQLKGYINILR